MAGAASARKARLVAGLVTVLAVMSSCSDGDDDGAAPAVTTTIQGATSSSTTSSSTTTTLVASVTSRPATTAGITPEIAAKSFFEAWTKGDRAAAARVAEPAAITTLFARAWQASDNWAFSECTGAAGSLICTWARPGGQQVLFRVQNAPATVAEVRFEP